MITRQIWHRNQAILTIFGGLCALGLLLIVDGLVTPGMRQHRLFALGVGGVLVLPLAGSVVFGGRFLQSAKFVFFSLGPVFVLLLVLEVAARTVGAETLSRPETRPDPVLGFAMVPGTTGVDDWGFRNRTVPDEADLVFLGDSNTYGFGVPLSGTLPSAFAKLTGSITYNMGIGGYGPIQYRELADKALSLDPDVVVACVYLGNDILDAHVMAGLERHSALRDPELDYQPIGDGDSLAAERNIASKVLLGLERNSRFLGWVTKHVRLALRTNRLLTGFYGQESDAPRYDRSPVQTVFSPRFRLSALDLSDPRIADGLRITRRCLEDLWAEVRAAGKQPFLLLLHTKEYYYYHFMRETEPGSEQLLEDIAAAEIRVTQALVAFAAEQEVGLVDPLEQVLAALREGGGMYPMNSDGHPTAYGQAVIASALAQGLKAP